MAASLAAMVPPQSPLSAAGGPPPVFLHAGWRSCSTYVWSRFRVLERARAYYEPFHEVLAGLTSAVIGADAPETSNLRHPQAGAPYMAELEPLLAPGGGVAGYDARFALQSYFMAAEADDPAQEAYVGRLIGRAWDEGRTPVIACCRTLGRAPWLKQRFGGVHVMLVRDPISQWASGHAFRRRRDRLSYFELCAFAILGLAGGGAGDWAGRWGAPRRLPPGDLGRAFRRVRAGLACRRPTASYAAFAAVYLLAHRRAQAVADLVLDVDRLSAEPGYAAGCERALADLTGLAPRFDGCRTPGWADSAPPADYQAVHAALARALPEEYALAEAAGLADRLEVSAARLGRPAPPRRPLELLLRPSASI